MSNFKKRVIELSAKLANKDTERTITIQDAVLQPTRVELKKDKLVIEYNLYSAKVFDSHGQGVEVELNSKNNGLKGLVEYEVESLLDNSIFVDFSGQTVNASDTVTRLATNVLEVVCRQSSIFKYVYGLPEIVTDNYTSAKKGRKIVVTILSPEIFDGSLLSQNQSFSDHVQIILDELQDSHIIL